MKRFSFIVTLVLAVVFGGGWLFKDQDLVMKARLMFLNASGSNTIVIHSGNANAFQIVDDAGTPISYLTVNSTPGSLAVTLGGPATPTGPTGGLLTLTSPPVFASAETALTAHAGGTQAAALLLSPSVFIHQVTTVGTAADSVALPPPVLGTCHLVVNEAAANSMQLFAVSPATVNGAATATGIAVAVKKGELCCAASSTDYACAGI